MPSSGSGSIYHSVADFSPGPDAQADASADLFHLRVQDFGSLAAEINRFAFFTATAAGPTRFTMDAAKNGGGVRTLLHEVVQSELFRTR